MPVPSGLIITIDGPAGTGKSSVAHGLAARLGIDFLDTGAMYRAVAAIGLMSGLDLHDGETLARQAAAAELAFDWSADPPHVLVKHPTPLDLTVRVREADVTLAVSIVAAQPEVRELLVRLQREIAQQHPRLVTEGRDQGSVVFPDADVKFFLDASAQIRAERRARQLRQSGRDADEAVILDEIKRRDEIDSTRAVGPLTKPDDAVVVDTSHMTEEQVVSELERIVRERVAPQVMVNTNSSTPSRRCTEDQV